MSFYYRNYHRRAPVEKVTNEDIPDRLVTLSGNSNVPQNTKDFLQSLADAFKKYKGLTVRQFEAFEKVEKRFSAEKIAERKAWSGEYTPERRSIAKICAEYYLANPPYFGDLAKKIVHDPDFVPSERQWRALCENKYAKKVLASAASEPKFLNGSMVMGRATSNSVFIRNKLLLIIEANAAPVKSAAKGSKIYRVLPVGSPNTILVEERLLKKAPKRK
jgi:hypothetical protein